MRAGYIPFFIKTIADVAKMTQKTGTVFCTVSSTNSLTLSLFHFLFYDSWNRQRRRIFHCEQMRLKRVGEECPINRRNDPLISSNKEL